MVQKHNRSLAHFDWRNVLALIVCLHVMPAASCSSGDNGNGAGGGGDIPIITAIGTVTSPGLYGIDAVLALTVTFSTPVMVTGTPTWALTLNDVVRTASYASGSGSDTLTFRYIVQAGDILELPSDIHVGGFALQNSTIESGYGIDADLTLPASLITPPAFGSTILIDGIVPTVQHVTSTAANQLYHLNDAIPIQVIFSEIVTVTETPLLTLDTGDPDTSAPYTAGSGSNTLIFTYTVQSGDFSADLTHNSTGALALGLGSIVDAAGNAAVLTLPERTASASLGVSKDIAVEARRPTITDVTPRSGLITGNTALTITGADYRAGATVLIGDEACANITRQSSTQITCTTPSGTHSVGDVGVRVTNTDDNQAISLDNGFYYSKLEVSPASGHRIGGTMITLTHLDAFFDNTTTVQLGTTPCDDVTFVSPSQLTCITPAQINTDAPDITVITGSNTALLPQGFAYTMFFLPKVFHHDVNSIVGESVMAMALHGNTLFIGGSFTHVLPPHGFGLPISTVTAGQPDGVAWPDISGNVTHVITDPIHPGAWYIAGSFSEIDEHPRTGLAHLHADGSLDTAWNPEMTGSQFPTSVGSIATDGEVLYVAGGFTAINGEARNFLAALTLATDASPAAEVVDWAPEPNNSVSRMIVDSAGQSLFVAGEFTQIGGVSRSKLAKIQLASLGIGVDPNWDPQPNSTVTAMVLGADRSLYVGGYFTQIGGSARAYLAKVDADHAGVASGWGPQITGTGVNALAIHGSSLFAGGAFTQVGDAARSNLAEVTLATGDVTSWAPAVDNPVEVLARSDTTLFVGGAFETINATDTLHLAAFDLTALGNTPLPWAPRPSDTVHALAVQGTTLYVGGSFRGLLSEGAERNNLAAIDISNGAILPWDPNVKSSTSETPNIAAISSMLLSQDGALLYVGGTFNNTVNGVPDTQEPTVGTASRNHLAAVRTDTGAATAWNPNITGDVYALILHPTAPVVYAGGAFTMVGGENRLRLAAISTDTGVPTAWTPEPTGGSVKTMAISADRLFVGGSFTSVFGTTRQRLAAFDMATATDPTLIAMWDPNLNAGTVHAMAARENSVYVVGAFSGAILDGQSRSSAARVSTQATVSGTYVDGAWAPAITTYGEHLAIAFSADGASCYLGGSFAEISGQEHQRIAKVDSQNGTPNPDWDPSEILIGPSWSQINAIVVRRNAVFASGVVNALGSHYPSNVTMISAETGLAY